ncbi:hypothetical protein [Ekhidna sp.]|uniref:hypothetical protein n=1 Tax=Ekhidna sp. TaxID=2608089 RepID=UPI003B597A24
MRSLFICILPLILICSCSSNNEEKDKINQLTQKVEKLETLLNDCQNKDHRTIDRVIAAYHDGNFDSVKILYAELQRIYPELHDLKSAMDKHYEVIKKETASIRKITEREEASRRAIQKLKTEKVGSTTLYTSPAFTHFEDRNLISIYIIQKDKQPPVLFMKLSYSGNDWIHFKKASLHYGDRSIEIPFDAFEHKETKKDAGVSEWIEVPISRSIVFFLKSFAKTIDAKTKLTGKHTETRTISSKERQAIIDVLNGFDALNSLN